MKERGRFRGARPLFGTGARRLAVAALIVALTAGALWGWREVRAHREDGEKVAVRFHVVPDSDKAADQQLKLAVRDAVWPEVERGLAEEDLARPETLERLRRIAAEEMARRGSEQSVRIVTDVTDAGDLAVVKIVLGSGRGANWFCVLAPPLCFADLEPVERIAPAPGDDPGPGGIRLAWKWLGRLFGRSSVPFEGVGDVDQDDVHADLAHSAPRDGDVGLGGKQTQ